MTGYGRSEAILENGKITVEIRTLNGKSADIGIKTSLLPKDKELGVRAKLAKVLSRGTIDFYMNWEPNTSSGAKAVNADLAAQYFAQIKALRESLPGAGLSSQDTAILLSAILRFPDVVEARKQDVIDENNWPSVDKAIDEALDGVVSFREKEGVALYGDVTSRVAKILAYVDQVETMEPERMETVRARLLRNLEELEQKPDQQRFEQEMIFYLEKLDINEEKVRLRQHCKYFMDTIDSEENPGKKLGFIIQEMGREINTTGSKANHAGIQKVVVLMKDELEKIREQSMNIL